MESESYGKIPATQTFVAFFLLALIRGSFSVLIHYGITVYKSPSLLFLLRTPGTLILFFISVLYLASKDEESKLEIVNNFKSSKSYKRAALLGFFQLSGPYMLFMYAMKYLSPTVGAVFMCAMPWSTSLLEKTLSLTVQRSSKNKWNFTGSIIGLIGVVAVSFVNICWVTMDPSCVTTYGYKNVTTNMTVDNSNSSVVNITQVKVELRANSCLTPQEIITAFLALCGSTCLWSISAVFSKYKRVSLHFLVGGLLNNLFGGLYAGILWVIVEWHINTKHVIWNSYDGSLSVIFLSVATSWAASLILYYLYQKIGAKSTNKVMCLVPFITWLEDLLFLHDLNHMYTWIIILEAIGIVLVGVGLYISSLQQEENSVLNAHVQLLPDNLSEEEDDCEHPTHFAIDVSPDQSEDEVMQSNVNSMQDSVEPPMIHYADDGSEDEGEVF